MALGAVGLLGWLLGWLLGELENRRIFLLLLLFQYMLYQLNFLLLILLYQLNFLLLFLLYYPNFVRLFLLYYHNFVPFPKSPLMEEQHQSVGYNQRWLTPFLISQML
jgi:hypothetical protein